MVVAFGEIGVTQGMIEGYLQHKITAIVPAQLVKLTGIYKSIKDGVADRTEFFSLDDLGNLQLHLAKLLKGDDAFKFFIFGFLFLFVVFVSFG